MRNLNRITLVGNVGRAPELRVTEGGKSMVKFSLATTDRFTDASGLEHERTEWHRIVAWEGLADLVGQYVGRGDPLFVEGELRSRKYEDADGVERTITEVHVQRGHALLFLSPKAAKAPPPPAA